MKRIILSTAVCGALLAPESGLAGCGAGAAADAAAGAGRVICITSERDTYDSEAPNLTVVVKPRAVVSSVDEDPAIDISEDFTTLSNAGTVRAADNAVLGGHGFVLNNTGSIAAARNAIELSGESGVEIRNSGEILATYQAVNMDARDGFGGAGNTLVNDGRIESARGEAVETGDDASIHNAAGAVMRAYDDAVQVGERATIVNHGLIQTVGMAGDPQDAIDIDSGTILNGAGGRIISDMEAAIDFDKSTIASVIDNAGEIRGVKGIIVETHPSIANVAAQEVINREGGVIAGSGGVSLMLGAGKDRLVNHQGARLDGSVLMGADADEIVLQGSYRGDFGGRGAVIDGGPGADRVVLPGYGFEQISGVELIRGGFVLSLESDAGVFEIALRNWESVDLGGAVYNAEEIAALAPERAAVIGAMLLAAGFVLLGLIGARGRVRRGLRAARREILRAAPGVQSARRTSA